MCILAAVHLSADDSLGILYRNLSRTLLNFDNADDHRDSEDHEDHDAYNRNGTFLKFDERLIDRARHSRYDTRHDDKGNTVSDSVLVDLFTQPHQECCAGRQSDDDYRNRKDGFVYDCAAEQSYSQTDRLNQRQYHRKISGILCDFLSAFGTFLGKRLETRDNHGQ